MSQTIESLTAQGYWEDTNSFHKRLIEDRQCKCKNYLTYKGYSNISNYFAFGVCEKCKRTVYFANFSDKVTDETFEFIERKAA